MATARGKHRLEIPESLWQALDQAAVKADIPTAELAAIWLWQHLEQKTKEGGMFDGIRAPQPYDRENSRHYPRRDYERSANARLAAIEADEAIIKAVADGDVYEASLLAKKALETRLLSHGQS